MTEYKTTRSGYRYGIDSADEIVRRAGEDFTLMCDEPRCWLIVQGGPAALADHKKTVHKEGVRLNR